MEILDLDLLRPDPKVIKLGGKEIDVSFIPCGITFDVDRITREISELGIEAIKKGGEHERKAWDDIDSLEEEYQYARSDAAEAVEAGDRKGALRVMREWNAEANRRIGEYNKRFSRYGLGDKGGLRKNMFTYEKMLNVIKKREDPRTPIVRRLSVR